MTLEGDPWFVATDVCRVLGSYIKRGGVVNATMALSRNGVTKEEISTTPIGTSIRSSMLMVSESGLYKLIMRSDKPNAKGFQDGGTKEVLPSIRKTGAFVTGQPRLLATCLQPSSLRPQRSSRTSAGILLNSPRLTQTLSPRWSLCPSVPP